MRANLIASLLAAGFSGHLKALVWRDVIASQEKLSPENEIPADEDVVIDAYKIAVMVLVGAAVLSVFL